MIMSQLIKGTIILTMSGIFIRILGLLNRMILSRWIGAEGLGLFQIIIPVYAMMIVIIGLGLPGAATKMIAERHALGDENGQELIKRKAIKMVLTAALFAIILYYPFIIIFGENLFPDTRALTALKILPAGIFFAAFSQILRSYFQGKKNMIPTAFSQAGEQTIRVISGLTGAYLLLPYGLEYAIAGIAFGIVSGEIIGFLILLTFDRLNQKRKEKIKIPEIHGEKIMKEMFALALPLVIIRLSGSFTHVVESLMIPSRLQKAGFSAAESITLFGELSGMALPLLFLPTVFIMPLNTALVPYVAQTVVLKQKEKLNQVTRLSLWGTLLLGLVASFVFRYFSAGLVSLFYGNPSSAPLVSMLSLSAPLAYLQFTTASILHGLGRPGIAVLNDLIGIIVALILIFYLTSLPWIGIYGAVWAYSASFGLTSLLGCICIRLIIKKKGLR